MKKNILFLTVVLLATISCSKDDDAKADSSFLPKKVVSISEEDGTSTTTISYDGNKIVETSSTKNGITSRRFYTYNGDVIVKIESFRNNELTNIEEYIYENGRLKTSFEAETEKTKNEYTYNTDGTILEVKYKFIDNTYVADNRTNLYTIAYGNLTKLVTNSSYTYTNNNSGIITTNTNTNKSTYTYQYDDKNNPLKNILGLNKIFIGELSLNNKVKQTSVSESSTNGGEVTTQPTRVKDYILSYNANNYLTESKYSYIANVPVQPGQQPSTVTKTDITQYFYE